VVPQVIQPPPVILDSAIPPPSPAPAAPKAKSKGSLIRSISMVLVLVLGFTFAFNLFNSDNPATISTGDDIYKGETDDTKNNGETLPDFIDNNLQFEKLILGNWRVAAVDLVQDSIVTSAIDQDPGFTALIGGTYLFKDDNTVLMASVNGYYETITYSVKGDEIYLAATAYDKGKINLLNDRTLVFTLPFVNEQGTFYLRYTLYK
jgi:hypothetical protein